MQKITKISHCFTVVFKNSDLFFETRYTWVYKKINYTVNLVPSVSIAQMHKNRSGEN